MVPDMDLGSGFQMIQILVSALSHTSIYKYIATYTCAYADRYLVSTYTHVCIYV